MATLSHEAARPPPPPPEETVAEPSLMKRFQKFLWLWSGMFSIAALFLAFASYFGLGGAGSNLQAAGTNFLAAIASAALFGLVSLLHFGPASS